MIRWRVFATPLPTFDIICLLKSIRAVSAFNAAIVLCDAGFTQEICVLLRTIVECTSHIEFVLSSNPISADAENFIADYFSDFERSGNPDFRKPAIRQGHVHSAVGAALDNFIKESEQAEKYRGVNTSKLYSRVYLVLSNYVHCKYPEVMDLYGGIPGKFHLKGMRGTPKDLENIELLETYFASVSQCLQVIVLRLGLKQFVERDPIVAQWMGSLRQET